MHGWLFLFLIILMPIQAVWAQDDQENLDMLVDMNLDDLLSLQVTSATKQSQTIPKAPAVIDIITAAEIRRFGYRSVGDAVASLPGLFVVTDHVSHNVSVRGVSGGFKASSRILKVMIDGQSVPFRATSENFLGPELIPIGLIKQIEVIRGPASALYGANAFLGIINVITFGPGELDSYGIRYHNALNGGNNKLARGGLEFHMERYLNNKTSLLLGAASSKEDRSGLDLPVSTPALQNHIDANGFERSAFDAQTQDDYARPMSFFARLRVESPRFYWTTDLSYQSLDSGARFYELNPVFNDSRVQVENAFLRQSLRWINREETLEINASAAYSDGSLGDDDRLDIDHPDNPEGVIIRRHQGYSGLDLALSAHLKHDHLDLLLGLDHTRDRQEPAAFERRLRADNSLLSDAQTDTDNAEDVFTNIGAYGQGVINLGNITSLTLGVRYDDHNIYGGEFNWRTGLILAPEKNWYAKILAGSSYRAPTASQLFSPAFPYHSATNVGNADLKTENARTLELSAGYTGIKDLRVQLTGFYNQLKRLIVYQQDLETGLLVPVNEDDIDAYGYELALDWLRHQFHLKTGLSYQHATLEGDRRDRITLANLSVTRRTTLYPEWIFSSDVSFYIKNVTLSVSAEHYSDMTASDQNTIENTVFGRPQIYEIDGATFADVALTTRDWRPLAGRETRLTLRIENLFETDIIQPGFFQYDIPDLGRSIQFTIHHLF